MPVEEDSNSSPAALSSGERELRLKEYDSLSFWNDNESKINLRIDALPISAIGGIAYAASQTELCVRTRVLIVGISSIPILVIWLALCWKYSRRIKKRFELMQGIERDLGFSAHIRMNDYIRNSYLQRYLTHFISRFFIVIIVAGAVAVAFLLN